MERRSVKKLILLVGLLAAIAAFVCLACLFFGTDKEVRNIMIGQTRIKNGIEQRRYCRKEINKRIGMIKSMFKWAVSEELLPANCYHALQTVTGLKWGRTSAPAPAPSLGLPAVSRAALAAPRAGR